MARGSFLGTDVREALLRMSSRRAVGTMIASNEGLVLTVTFDQGAIVAADLNEPFGEGLGPMLVEQGILNSDDFEAVSESRLRLPSDAMAALVSRDMLSEEEFFEGHRSYVFRLLVRLLLWEGGDFKFYDSEPSGEQSFRPLSVEELLVRASEEIPAVLGTTVPPLGDHAFRKLVEDDGSDGLEGGRRSHRELLTRLEERVLKLADGTMPSIEYLDELGGDEYRVRFAIHRLVKEGLVEACEGRQPEAPLRESDEADSGLQDDGDTIELDSNLDGSIDALETDSEPDFDAPVVTRAKRSRARRIPLGLGEMKRVFRGVTLGWSYLLSVSLVVVLVTGVLGGDSSFLLHPLPWQSGSLLAFESAQRTAAYRRVQRAVSTGHLVDGKAPRELSRLVEQSLLAPSDLYDSGGRWLMFGLWENGFSLESVAAGEMAEGAEVRFSHSGDFLLDLAFREGNSAGPGSLVLLD